MNTYTRITVVLLAAAVLMAAALPGAVWADIYRWVDENGGVHFSNAPTDVKFKLYLKETNLTGKQFVQKYDKAIRRQASIHGVDPNLVKAVIRAESGYNPTAISKKGAQGLMQLMPETAAKMDVSDPFNPDENIAGGVKFLSQLLVRFRNDITLAVAAYNAGPEAVEKYNNVPPYRETRRFVVKVLKFYRDYHNQSR